MISLGPRRGVDIDELDNRCRACRDEEGAQSVGRAVDEAGELTGDSSKPAKVLAITIWT